MQHGKIYKIEIQATRWRDSFASTETGDAWTVNYISIVSFHCTYAKNIYLW